MNTVYVASAGIISSAALTAEELAESFGGEQAHYELPLAFTTKVPSSKLRRCSRYIKMACAVADQALSASAATGRFPPERTGAVFSTGFGAVESNITFSDSVVKGDPALCSPSVFSATVPNSCLGQICMVNSLRGEGTMLMGGDPAEYSALLLNTGKADVILCGGIEEYSKELYGSMETSGEQLSEGAAALVLTAKQSESDLCKITGFSSSSFPKSPYRAADAASADTIKTALLSAEVPDVIFAAGNGSAFDEAERKAINEVFPDAEVVYPKKIFGEALGAAYMQSAALAALCLDRKKIPDSSLESFGRILVCGFDCVGNYSCLMMEAL